MTHYRRVRNNAGWKAKQIERPISSIKGVYIVFLGTDFADFIFIFIFF